MTSLAPPCCITVTAFLKDTSSPAVTLKYRPPVASPQHHLLMQPGDAPCLFHGKSHPYARDATTKSPLNRDSHHLATKLSTATHQACKTHSLEFTLCHSSFFLYDITSLCTLHQGVRTTTGALHATELAPALELHGVNLLSAHSPWLQARWLPLSARGRTSRPVFV